MTTSKECQDSWENIELKLLTYSMAACLIASFQGRRACPAPCSTSSCPCSCLRFRAGRTFIRNIWHMRNWKIDSKNQAFLTPSQSILSSWLQYRQLKMQAHQKAKLWILISDRPAPVVIFPAGKAGWGLIGHIGCTLFHFLSLLFWSILTREYKRENP